MSVALRGNLQDFGIAEVFQLIGQQRKTGVLDVSDGDQQVRLAFDAGSVVWARPIGDTADAVLGDQLVRCGLLTRERMVDLQRESEASARPLGPLVVEGGGIAAADVEQIEDLITNDTIFVVLRWTLGSFDFSAQAVNHTRPPEKLLGAEQILMDGLRKVDEWATFAALVPSGDSVFARSGSIESYRLEVKPDPQQLGRAERMFSLVDGRLTVSRVIDLSRLGLFEATRGLAELHKHKLVALESRPARSRKKTQSERPSFDRARWWLAAAFPLALLSLVVSAILNDARPFEGVKAFPIERAPLAEARESFDKRKLRQLLEKERMLRAAWPETLDAWRGADGKSDTLTPSAADDYYYARRGNGIVLLAPER